MATDVSQLLKLARDLERAGRTVPNQSPAILEATLRTIETGMKAAFTGHPSIPHFPASITHEVQKTAAGARGQVGPDFNKPQGGLGAVLAFGTSDTPPVGDIYGPALREEPKLAAALLKLGVDSLA